MPLTRPKERAKPMHINVTHEGETGSPCVRSAHMSAAQRSAGVNNSLTRFLAAAAFVSALVACSAYAARVTLTGTVTDEKTGQPIFDAEVGAVRSVSLRPDDASRAVPVESSVHTDSAGRYRFEVDSATAGLEKVLVFTRSVGYVNELYDDVTYTGRAPLNGDAAKPGIVQIDARADVQGIDFALEPAAISAKTTHMLAMKDGARLATDVYLPQGPGPWPVVLVRTTYDKNENHRGLELTDAGFAAVVQDCRGTHGSEGVFHGFMDDGWGENKDGYETVQWILQQPWCNGRIATTGGSALGITQNMLAGSVPPGLTCQYVVVAASDLYSQGLFHQGAFRKRLAEGWMAGRGEAAFDYLREQLMKQPLYSDDFWAYVNFETRHHLVNWPILNRGGWYDIFLRGTINNFVNIQHNGKPGAAGKQRLIIGPYGHGKGDGGFVWPENRTHPHAHMSSNSEGAWFSHWLKDAPNAVTNEPAVCYYVLGDVDAPDGPGNTWRFADDWPVPSTPVRYYFHEGGTLDTVAPGPGEKPNTYVFDPANPVPTLGGANLSGTRGPYDQRPVESRPDVILFTTPALDAPIEVTGTILVKLWASSSAVDTDFTAKLCDVYPDGRSMIVCDGIVRARHRNTMGKEEFLTPNTAYEFTIDLWETCIAFNTGHRIRVAVSSSNFDRFDVNPNTGEPFYRHTHLISATNTIFHDAERPSYVLLPVTSAVKH